MKVIHTITELREIVQIYKKNNDKVGLVPTMGNLHKGHLDLVAKASSTSDRTVVSIFVNPTQFDQSSDLDAYPRTLKDDLAQLDSLGVDIVFCPQPNEMYPQGGLVTEVDIPRISALHEGASRPGHFKGVATVVCKLLNIVAPDLAVFGEKDFQQLSLIRQMVFDLDMPIQIIGAATVREADGLAMSSRNGRLTAEERRVAPNLFKALKQVEECVLSGDANYLALEKEAINSLAALGFKPDYIQVCNASTLRVAKADDRELVVLAAAYLGSVRLIDNLQMSLS